MEADDIVLLEYTDLTSFLLNVMRPRKGMFLQEPTISHLSIFITGYRVGLTIGNKIEDKYFGKNGFIDWFCKRYNVNEPSYIMMPFLDKANNDEKKALELYFEYLQEYQHSMNK